MIILQRIKEMTPQQVYVKLTIIVFVTNHDYVEEYNRFEQNIFLS